MLLLDGAHSTKSTKSKNKILPKATNFISWGHTSECTMNAHLRCVISICHDRLTQTLVAMTSSGARETKYTGLKFTKCIMKKAHF